jgi:hypothetical protein
VSRYRGSDERMVTVHEETVFSSSVVPRFEVQSRGRVFEDVAKRTQSLLFHLDPNREGRGCTISKDVMEGHLRIGRSVSIVKISEGGLGSFSFTGPVTVSEIWVIHG